MVKLISYFLWVLGALLVLAMFAAFGICCWSSGADVGHWFGTGFVLALAAVVALCCAEVVGDKAK